MSILAIDFGGTRTRAAWVTFDSHWKHTIHQRVETLTRATDPQDVVIERLITLARKVIPVGQVPEAVGIAAPGPADNAKGLIYHSYALPGWENVPLGNILNDTFSAPVFMQNDGNLGAVAEYTSGAGHGCNPMMYMTISTGIGGGVIIDGKLFTGWSGLAAEPGHLIVTTPAGHPMRLEAVASGTGIGEQARHQLSAFDTPSILRTAPIVDGAAVGKAAQDGDAFALSLIDQTATYLGLGIVSLLHQFSPEAIVIGGSVSKLGNLLFAPTRRVIEQHVLDPRFIPPNLIRPAHFGEDVCLTGAALWAAGRGQLRS